MIKLRKMIITTIVVRISVRDKARSKTITRTQVPVVIIQFLRQHFRCKIDVRWV